MKTRKNRRQAERRLKRNAMQSLMVLRGWVPVQLNAQYGIYHHGENRLVIRKWEVEKDDKPQGLNMGFVRRALFPKGRWTVQCIQLSAPFNGTECGWNEIQLRWVHALRSAAISRGWYTP